MTRTPAARPGSCACCWCRPLPARGYASAVLGLLGLLDGGRRTRDDGLVSDARRLDPRQRLGGLGEDGHARGRDDVAHVEGGLEVLE